MRQQDGEVKNLSNVIYHGLDKAVRRGRRTLQRLRVCGTLTSTVPYGLVHFSHQFPLLFKSFLYFFHKIKGRDRFQRRTEGKHSYHKLAFVLRHIPQF